MSYIGQHEVGTSTNHIVWVWDMLVGYVVFWLSKLYQGEDRFNVSTVWHGRAKGHLIKIWLVYGRGIVPLVVYKKFRALWNYGGREVYSKPPPQSSYVFF